jgi:uncharacterized membrane protein
MFKILEIIWLAIGVIGVLMTCYFIVMKDRDGAIFFVIFTGIAGFKYAVHKRRRIRMEGNPNQIIKK